MKNEPTPQNEAQGQPQVGSSAWLEVLTKELRARGKHHLNIGLNQNDQSHLTAGLVLDSIGMCIERTLWSTSNVGFSDRAN